MPKSDITVTMPLEEYEGMKNQIDNLKKKNINNFVDDVYENGDIFTNKSAFVLNNAKLQALYRKKVHLPGEVINYEV